MKVIDPVCGMVADPKTAPKAEFDGVTHCLCGVGCRAKFIADPDKYKKRRAPQPQTADSDVIYTCPMHPQIQQKGPSSCPICGMALALSSACAIGNAFIPLN